VVGVVLELEVVLLSIDEAAAAAGAAEPVGGTSLGGGFVLNILSKFSIRISTTTLQNFMSMMAATVSSSGRRRVGPKHTPRLLTVILFFSDLDETL
jgi:hypothetical protein